MRADQTAAWNHLSDYAKAFSSFDLRTEFARDAGRAVQGESLEAVVVMLSPIVPHVCHALWQALGHESALIDQRWPNVDESALEVDRIEMVIQVNGKLRGRLSVAVDAPKNVVEAMALADENVQRFIDGNNIRKVIVVPGRLVNIVV